jgi:hydrogenase maturation protease
MINKTLVLGFGNILRKDDGIGPKVIQILQQKNLPNIDLIDGGLDSLALLDKIAEYKKAIIIDAVNMNEKPCTIKSFAPEDALIKIKSDALSTHGFGLAELIKLMQQLQMETQFHIIGIEPKDITFGENLTPEIENKIPDIIEEISCLIH